MEMPSLTRRRALQGSAVGLAAAVAGAGVGVSAARQATPSATEGVTGEAVSRAAADLEGVIQGFMATTGVPGVAVAIVHQDAVVHAAGYGVREVGTREAVDADTVFQLASVSKCLAATTVAAIVGDGVVTWDDRVSDLDP